MVHIVQTFNHPEMVQNCIPLVSRTVDDGDLEGVGLLGSVAASAYLVRKGLVPLSWHTRGSGSGGKRFRAGSNGGDGVLEPM
jgi:hypothetical protein